MAEPAGIRFTVTGLRQGGTRGFGRTATSPIGLGTLADSVRLAAQRGQGDRVTVEAVPGRDAVVLQLANGPTLVLHPENARDLLRAQAAPAGTASRGAADADHDDGSVKVAPGLRWSGMEAAASTRGIGTVGEVLLTAFHVITGIGSGATGSLLANAVVQKMDGQVDAGVYALAADALKPLKGSGRKLAAVPAAGGPMLVLLHGTFSSTAGTFGKLWAEHPQAVRALFRFYGDRVYALDHPTLAASPVANARLLVKALPRGARLHLLSHSRGGLVGEVLARLADQRSLSAAELAPFTEAERSDLKALAAEMKDKQVAVERFVRVACPARGTLLASKRLDAYISVLRWALELAAVPVAPELLALLGEVASHRADPTELPGLAAMIPDSPLTRWLNGGAPIKGQLRVIAGDLQGDTLGSWIKTLLADAYYWTDNDIVVHTRSMYGGTPRSDGAQFLLDQGGKTTHFAYFSNPRTVDGVVAGLTQDRPAGWRTIGPLSWQGQDAGGQRAAAPAPDASKPAVFVIPGILGSNLKVGDDRIWLSARLIGGLSKLRYTLGQADAVQPDGPIGLIYDKLIAHLRGTHEVVPFAYDWRRPIEEEAQRLADLIDEKLAARASTGQAVRLLAHSMGGLVARTVQLERPETWRKLMARDGARLVMLGTPNGGSWAPMTVLSGDDTFGNALASLGSPLQDHDARMLMAAMPGFLQLQAGLTDPALRLDDPQRWADIAAKDLAAVQKSNWWHRNFMQEETAQNQLTAYRWGLPPAAVLQAARRLRERLDQQKEQALPQWCDKLALVTGRAKFTPGGFEEGPEGLVYLDAPEGGDGRVPLSSALLPGVKTWTLDCEHGSLPSEEAAFAAFDDLLAAGTTERLPPLPATRGGAAAGGGTRAKSRPSRTPARPTPPETETEVFSSGRGMAVESPDAAAGAALRVQVQNGNLAFVRQPLMLGHYRSLTLTGTERVVDNLVGHAMGISLASGLYPDAPGTVQVFVNRHIDRANPWRTPRPECAVIVGLGDEGKLRERELSLTVRQGVIAWAQRVAESAGAPASFELASVLMGSGGIGVQAGNAARAIAQGVRDANERLAASGWPVVEKLTLVELFLERAADAWHGLQVLATAMPGHFDVAPTIQAGIGALRRQVDTGYRGTDYDFISATMQNEGTVAFTLDSKRARSELRAQVTQVALVREMVRRASDADNQDEQIGRTLFQLLVPQEVEPFLGGTSHMVLEVDAGTAPIPWEMLDTPDDRRGGGDGRPWAIRSKLLRKMRTAQFREQPADAGVDDSVLVIGEPLVTDKAYGPLPGALAEAKAVVQALGEGGVVATDRIVALTEHDDATAIVNALLARRYRIVHISGHGEAGENGGVVLSGGTFLGPREIRNMRTVPELVFVNCCHLAGREPGQALRGFDRAAFAAGVADELIRIGVRCVIAAGWAVEDMQASLFATTFYRGLQQGARFIDAVAAAREAAWSMGGNTWAAYQCYGDPNWTLNRQEDAARAAAAARRDYAEYASISSPMALALVLEQLAVESKWQGAKADEQRDKIRWLEERFGTLWGGMGAVAEAFGVACAEARDSKAAIAWYERALGANDASASMKVVEQLANLRARAAWDDVNAAAKPAKADFDRGRRAIRDALKTLDALSALHATVERASLAGSAWKRLALLEERAGNDGARRQALKASTEAYRQAEAMAAETSPGELFYPALNRIACELVARMDDDRWGGLDEAAVQAARASLEARCHDDPDFWSMVSKADLELFRAVAARDVARHAKDIRAGYEDVHTAVPTTGSWKSVADQAAFVLGPYMRLARGAEKQAAQDLLALLEGWARPVPPAAA